MSTIPHETTVQIIGHSSDGIPCNALVDTGAERSSLRVCKCNVNESNGTVTYTLRDNNASFSQPVIDIVNTKTSAGTEQRPVISLRVKYDESAEPVVLNCSLTESDMKHDIVLGVDFLTETGLTVDVVDNSTNASESVAVHEDEEMSIVDTIGSEENAEQDVSGLANDQPPCESTPDRAIDVVVDLLMANPDITLGDIIRRIRTKVTESLQY
jgi:hypothetical protein